MLSAFVSLPRSVSGDATRLSASVRAAFAALPQGPSLRSELFCLGPSMLIRPHPPHSQAHPDFTAQRLIRNAFAVHTAPRRPPSGSTLSLSFLPNMPPSTTPGRSETGWFQSCGPDIGLRHVMSGSALPTILLSASRRADFSELHWFAFAAACQVARPLCRSDQKLFRPPGLLLPGFRRVGHPSRRWI